MVTSRFYTLKGAADALGTNRKRIATLIERTGVVLEPIGTALVMDAKAFRKLKAAHARRPPRRPGRPPSGPPAD